MIARWARQDTRRRTDMDENNDLAPGTVSIVGGRSVGGQRRDGEI